MWIGLDDTDSIFAGGCTTYAAYLIISHLSREGYSIIGYPRLVRLNPNIPWKTRGNGALSFRIAKEGIGKILIGMNDGIKIYGYREVKNEYGDLEEVFDIIKEIFEKEIRLTDKNTNPGLVAVKEKIDYGFYEKAVKNIVPLNDALSLLDKNDALYVGYRNRRGLIGAAASIAWNPIHDRTYELITYRREEKIGSKREIDDESVKIMDKKIVTTFDNYDYANEHNRIKPNSPCPVLYGIRGDKAEDLIKAMNIIKSEDFQGWMIFESNQGTDEHLQRKEKIKDVVPFESVILEGTVCEEPLTIPGGHVIFRIKDRENRYMDCAAYEPTKEFRKIVRKLKGGDVVEVYGGVREKPFTLNLEKIRIKRVAKIVEKVENPICEKCGKHMKSLGKKEGFRCIKCGTKADAGKAKYAIVERNLLPGFYEVPVCARRHLSKPLKRMIKET